MGDDLRLNRFVVEEKYSKEKSEELFLGNELTNDCFSKLIQANENTIVYRDKDQTDVLCAIVKGVYRGELKSKIKETLYSINERSGLRTKASGKIDKKELERTMGWVEGVDYKMVNDNCYVQRYSDKMIKQGKTGWSKVRRGNRIHSITGGYFQNRTTKVKGATEWTRKNPAKHEIVATMSYYNEVALRYVDSKTCREQREFAKQFIPLHLRDGIFTTYNLNKYNEQHTKKMTAHYDNIRNFGKGLSTIATFRLGSYSGAYFCIPRYDIAIDAEDGDVIIANVKELHGVTNIEGKGTRLSAVVYCDERLANDQPIEPIEMIAA